MPANEYSPSVQSFYTTGGVSELLLPQNPRRTSVWIQPLTEDITINFGAVAGTRATGTLAFVDNPANAETIAINGVTITFLTTVADPTDEVEIGDNEKETRDNLLALLQASEDADLLEAEYEATEVSGDPGILITFKQGGVAGNAYTLANSSSANVVASGTTLEGGLDTGNGFLWLQNSEHWVNVAQFSSAGEEIYVISENADSEIVYLEAIGGV
ncbi:hypothetical protein [Geitlerinema calcuttense]|uniref:Uncharacterized protein n=1 Tax=Geitlerinema calcuttense NRMC-F 0142 TaxID=2922238 RepID=A0ABT7LUZ1_9CYAN|nr:hypothetical protein [Geitlerinema calcuttense]MDL5055883.1 hypothetical protein [Geitlerinema calcuttense NRMC-F 0142]